MSLKDTIFNDGQALIKTKDNGYVIGGTGSGFIDAGILKTDSVGKKLWYKTYGGTLSDGIYSIAETNDGGFIAAGIRKNSTFSWNNVFILKTDSIGTLQWDKTFGGTLSDHLYSVIQTNDSGFLATGYYSSPTGIKVLLIKLTSNGSVQWTKAIGCASGGITDAEEIIQTQNGDYVVAGYADDAGTGDWNMFLMKLDVGGNVLWAKTYGGINRDEVRAFTQTSDGGYLLTGYSETFNPAGEALFVKTDSLGNVQWSRRYWDNSVIFFGYSVIQTEDYGYCIGGQTGLLKIDSLGNQEWFERYSNKYLIFDLLQTQDKGFVISGYETTGNANRLLLAKTDEMGQVGCFSSLVPLNTASVSVTTANATQVISNISILINAPLVMAIPNVTDTSFCAPCGPVTPVFTYTITSNAVSFSDNSINASNWYWDFGDGFNSTLQNPAHTYSAVGSYTVCLTASNACNASSICSTIIITVVSLPQEIENENITVSPNPTRGLIYISYSSNTTEIFVTDVVGRKVLSVNNNEKTIDLSPAPSGIYFLNVKTPDGVAVKKIIKQ